MGNIILLLSLVTVLVVSCASTKGLDVDKQTTTLDDVYISGGTEKFFLGDLPHWANYSTFSKCQRVTPVKYVNFENIQKSYNLDYMSAVHMQNMINRKISNFIKSSGETRLPSKDESYIFNTVYAEVLGKSYDFRKPKFTRMSVIWIDPFLNDEAEITKIMENSQVLSGHPIFLSHCLSSIELESLVERLGLEDFGVKVIASDMFSRFDKEMNPVYDQEIDLSEILSGKTIHFFGIEQPVQIKGITKFNQLKIRGNDV